MVEFMSQKAEMHLKTGNKKFVFINTIKKITSLRKFGVNLNFSALLNAWTTDLDGDLVYMQGRYGLDNNYLTRTCSSLRLYATSRKAAGSTPDEVDFSIDLILPAAVCPWGRQSL
jgi:hypothetical protein